MLVTPTFQLLYLHSWKIAMSTNFRAGLAVAKERHDRDSQGPFPVLLPCQHHGDTKYSHWQTLGSEPVAKPFNRWHEPHYIMPNYWWLLRQDTGSMHPTCEPTGNTEEWGSPCSKPHSERRLGCCGLQHSSPEAELPQRHYVGPIWGSLHSC